MVSLTAVRIDGLDGALVASADAAGSTNEQKGMQEVTLYVRRPLLLQTKYLAVLLEDSRYEGLIAKAETAFLNLGARCMAFEWRLGPSTKNVLSA